MILPIYEILKLFKPFQLGLVFFTYGLGGGILKYLGLPIDLAAYLLGQGILFLLLVSSHLLKEYFNLLIPGEFSRQYPELAKMDFSSRKIRGTRSAFLQAALAALTAAVLITILLFINGVIGLLTVLTISLAIILGIFYATPPFRLVYSGYGELIQAVLLVNLTPAIAILIQTNQFHRLLGMITFPITFFYISMVLAVSFKQYAADLKYERVTMLTRMGWQKGLFIHNIFLLVAYLLIGVSVLGGLPWSITWPALLTLPFAIYQIYQFVGILNGAKPNWKGIHLIAYALVIISIYTFGFSLWVG